jgi:hypothetical protein
MILVSAERRLSALQAEAAQLAKIAELQSLDAGLQFAIWHKAVSRAKTC